MDAIDESVVPGFEKFTTVQNVLDQNKILINEINANHEARTPEGLARNVVLIKELNSNVSKVVELYKDITAAFEELANEPDAPKPQTPMNPE